MTVPGLKCVFCLRYSNLMAYSMIWQRKKQFTVAGNRECKQTNSINFGQSSLKSHPLWFIPEIQKLFERIN